MNVEKHVEYWRNGSDEDWRVAEKLVLSGETRHGLFFAHLALEKVLKAFVCQTTREFAPKIHNLVRLSGLAGISLTEALLDLLADMNQYNIEGRYPEMLSKPPNSSEARDILRKCSEARTWLNEQLSRT